MQSIQLIQLSSIQFNLLQFNSIRFSSIQFNSIQFSSIQFSSIQFNLVQFNSIQFNSIQLNSFYLPNGFIDHTIWFNFRQMLKTIFGINDCNNTYKNMDKCDSTPVNEAHVGKCHFEWVLDINLMLDYLYCNFYPSVVVMWLSLVPLDFYSQLSLCYGHVSYWVRRFRTCLRAVLGVW